MGLFDKIMKSVSDLANSDEAQKLKKDLEDIAKNSTVNKENNQKSGYSIPEEYSHFPVFNGKINNLITKNEPKYKRVSLTYNNVTDEEVDDYIKTIEAAGYDKKTDVRYEKNNEYIIVDNKGYLNIVYHVKF